jgi:DNA-binding MarR family transcriptional regulator
MTTKDQPGVDSDERHPTQDLDDVVHQRVRLGILAVLDEAGKADFNYVATTLELTNGNLSRHLRVLEDAGLLAIDKRIEDRRPRSWLRLTNAGRKALHAEVALLRALVERVQIP